MSRVNYIFGLRSFLNFFFIKLFFVTLNHKSCLRKLRAKLYSLSSYATSQHCVLCRETTEKIRAKIILSASNRSAFHITSTFKQILSTKSSTKKNFTSAWKRQQHKMWKCSLGEAKKMFFSCERPKSDSRLREQKIRLCIVGSQIKLLCLERGRRKKEAGRSGIWVSF